MRYMNYAISEETKTPLIEANEKISLKCALESIVLLKNENNTLPLTDLSIDLFGNGSAKKWVLLANHYDVSMIRNYLAFGLGEVIGADYVSTSQFVDLYTLKWIYPEK